MAIEDIVTGDTVKCVYYSLDEFADAASKRVHNGPGKDCLRGDSWAGGSFDDAVRLAKEGWNKHLAETLSIAESAVDMVEKSHEIKSFVPAWDVSGAEVDVARYLSGEPENMIDYPMLDVSKHGRVITLCASVAYSGSVNPEDIKRRGMVLCALALLLSRIGYASELWITCSSRSWGGSKADIKVLVKGTNDTLDPSRVMFAYAHPGVLRSLMFGTMHGFPAKFRQALNIGGSYGKPESPIQDLPEGTIYLPEVRSARGAPNAHEELRALLREMGILAGS